MNFGLPRPFFIFLNLYLRQGKSREDKEWNKSQMELATAIKSDVYKEALFARVMVALNKAEREGIIIKNPGKDSDRVWLTIPNAPTRIF